MFRLFRRRKKDKKKEESVEEKIDSKIAIPPQTPEISEEIQEDSQAQQLEGFSASETPFEERFATIPKIITKPIPEEPEIAEPIWDFLPFAEPVVETENSINSFVSPELLKPQVPKSEQATVSITTAELTPVTLEERIEGALFSIGRPIHATELIESLQEESPHLKRTLRKVSRQRKRTSPIVIEEISKDRWVLQLNPIYHEFFQSIVPEQFLTPEERRIITEIAYRQPISLAMVKKIVRKIGPVKITEICRNLEARGYIVGEKRARSLVYTSTPKFAHDFGFDDESRRLKLQMLWRLRRLMGDYEVEEEELEEELAEEGTEAEKDEKKGEEEGEEVEAEVEEEVEIELIEDLEEKTETEKDLEEIEEEEGVVEEVEEDPEKELKIDEEPEAEIEPSEIGEKAKEHESSEKGENEDPTEKKI